MRKNCKVKGWMLKCSYRVNIFQKRKKWKTKLAVWQRSQREKGSGKTTRRRFFLVSQGCRSHVPAGTRFPKLIPKHPPMILITFMHLACIKHCHKHIEWRKHLKHSDLVHGVNISNKKQKQEHVKEGFLYTKRKQPMQPFYEPLHPYEKTHLQSIDTYCNWHNSKCCS